MAPIPPLSPSSPSPAPFSPAPLSPAPQKQKPARWMIIGGAVAVGLLMGIGGTLLWREESKERIVVPTPTGTPSSCTDSDAHEDKNAIYVKGTVAFTDERNVRSSYSDECTETKLKVNEMWCHESPLGSGKWKVEKKIFDCPYGCRNDACIKEGEMATTVKKTSYVPPYPLVWSDQGAEFNLTDVSLGKILAPPKLTKVPSGGTYTAGEEVHALVLHFKITSGETSQCIQMKLRRIVNEGGDLAPPNTSSFIFPGTGRNDTCPLPRTTYTDQKVIFVVPEEEKSFLVTTGGSSNIFFTVYLASDNTLKVERAPQSE